MANQPSATADPDRTDTPIAEIYADLRDKRTLASLAALADQPIPAVDDIPQTIAEADAAAIPPAVPPAAPPEELAALTEVNDATDRPTLLVELREVLRGYHLKVIRIRTAGISFAALFSVGGSLLFNAALFLCLFYLGFRSLLAEWDLSPGNTSESGSSGSRGDIVVSSPPLAEEASPQPLAANPLSPMPTLPEALSAAAADPLSSARLTPPHPADDGQKDLIAFGTDAEPVFNSPPPLGLARNQTHVSGPPKSSLPLPVDSENASPSGGGSGDQTDGEDGPRKIINLMKPGSGDGEGDGSDSGAGHAGIDMECAILTPIDVQEPLGLAISGKRVHLPFDVLVHADGTAGPVKLMGDSVDREFEGTIMRALQRAKFRPQYLNGRAVECHFSWIWGDKREQ